MNRQQIEKNKKIERLIILAQTKKPKDCELECYCDICDAREQIVLEYTPTLNKLAKKYSTDSINWKELRGEGWIGLLKAINRFDPDKGVLFHTYAYACIETHINVCDLLFGIIQLPDYIKKITRRINKAKMDLLMELHREPTIDEIFKSVCSISEKIGGHIITKNDIIEIENMTFRKQVLDLNNNVPDTDDLIFADIIGEEDNQFKLIELKDELNYLLKDLTPDEKKILCHGKGALGYEFLENKDIGKLLDEPISAVSVSRRRGEILAEIRKNKIDGNPSVDL